MWATHMSDGIDKTKEEEALELGADVVGGIAGGVIGFLVAGPAGAALGGASGPLVKRALGDFLDRTLSKKEKARIGGTVAVAIERFEVNLKGGLTPRTDLRDDSIPVREELIEGALQKARNSYQEKKVRLLGNILANFYFIPRLSVDDGHEILNIVDELSYRQLVILGCIRRGEQEEWRKTDYRGVPVNLPTNSLLQEMYDLAVRGLVICKKDDAEMATFLLGWHDVAPADLRLTAVGNLLVALAGTDSIPGEDRSSAGSLLRATESDSPSP